jgi:hypothetical protein
MTPDIIFLHYRNISEAYKKNGFTCPFSKEEVSLLVIKKFAFITRKKAANPYFKHNSHRATIRC